MAEILEGQDLESTTVAIYRTAAVVKGGRRFSFGALVVVGDRNGRVGLGYGKAPGVPAAIEKAQKDARKSMFTVNVEGGTLPHPVTANFSASKVRLLPAAPGTGVIAGGTVRAVLELAGVRDCLTKAYGSTNEKNLCKATLEGLKSLRTKGQIESFRGLELEDTDVQQKVARGARYAPATTGAVKAKAPVSEVGDKKGGRGRGRGKGGDKGGGGGGNRGGGGGGVSVTVKDQPKKKEAPAQAAAEAPAEEAPATEAPAPEATTQGREEKKD